MPGVDPTATYVAFACHLPVRPYGDLRFVRGIRVIFPEKSSGLTPPKLSSRGWRSRREKMSSSSRPCEAIVMRGDDMLKLDPVLRGVRPIIPCTLAKSSHDEPTGWTR